MDPYEEQRAIRSGRAALLLSERRVVRVSGADARGWLSDLLTAEVRDLGSGASRTAMLLTPTGRVRAVITVAHPLKDLLLVQDPSQPEDIARLLAPYVLSSDVELTEEHLSVASILDASRVPEGSISSRPSWLGRGADVFGKGPGIRAEISDVEWVTEEAVERWRIEEGLARFPADLGRDSLPHEVEHGSAVEEHKGCYLGQEAVARVRNLGHPPWIVLAVRGEGPLRAGEPLRADDEDAGSVTSASGTSGIARVRWRSRGGPLQTGDGSKVEVLRQAGLTP